MQYIDLEIHALTPAVAPSLAACWGRERKDWSAVISIFSPLSFNPLSNTPLFGYKNQNK
jgi:hypothetical protein